GGAPGRDRQGRARVHRPEPAGLAGAADRLIGAGSIVEQIGREFVMKIASLETDIVLLPNDEPLAGFSENPNAKNPIVTLRLRTDDGVEGLGVAYFGGALTRTLHHAVEELGALTIGEDPL